MPLETNQGKLPLTLISGFLGAGKTTLLKHILRNKDNLRVCVIVNDMASLNIDASLIKNTKLIQTAEKMVELQNGCICCTLRDDLLQEVGALARSGKFDYLVIESTGISEPMQVAETFTMDFEDSQGTQALHELAVLDTCVTVVDATNLLLNAESLESLRDRGEAADEEDDRNVADLLLDQLEFANVIVLNKIDLVTEKESKQLASLLEVLNPEAKVIKAVNAVVSLEDIIATNMFSFEKASRSAGWLQSLQAETPHVPETIEYGISSFVYRARKPFDPEKIYAFMNTYFYLQEPDWRDAIAENHQGSNTGTGKGVNECIEAALESLQTARGLVQERKSHFSADEERTASTALNFLSAALSAAESAGQFVQMLKFDDKEIDNIEVANRERPRSAKEMTSHLKLLKSEFGNVLRSKGFIWLASRPNLCGEWSQAGGILRFTVGGPWYASLPDEAWPLGQEQRQDILKDFQDPFGDRRQELVMIGIDMKSDKLIQALDSCLLHDYNMDDNTKIIFKDPFAAWPALEDILDAGEEEDDDDDDVHDEVESINVSYRDSIAPSTSSLSQNNDIQSSGPVFYITEGASEAQAILDTMEQGTQAIFHWHANWHSESEYAFHCVSDTVQGKDVALIHVDIAGNHPNWSFAMEKVMTRPEARRQGAKPILKHGAKWPCFTVHVAPQLQPFETFTGNTAVDDIVSVIASCPDAKSKVSPPKEEAPVSIRSHQTVSIPEDRGSETMMLETIVELSGVDLDEEEQVDIPTLTNGAFQLREILRETNSMDQELFIIWYEKSLSSNILKYLKKSCKTSCKTIRAMTADILGSSGNKSLADAFKVTGTPTILSFAKMKLQKKVEGFDKVLSLIQNEFNVCQTTNLMTSSTSTTTMSFSSTSTIGSEGLYDPPKNSAGSKATKLSKDGKIVHFFPKMPCLRCGCPWWSSDDWDARCIRCGWDCEKGGYDDDSKPLPQHKDQWSKFVMSIRNGVTPTWNGKQL
eukprot:jgi/Picsp_1/3878/NSC_01390-R1_cobalamin synthesis protein p47k